MSAIMHSQEFLSRLRAWHRSVLVASVLLLLGVVGLANALIAPDVSASDPTSVRLAQCEADSGVVGEALATNGIDLRSKNWSRNRDRAIQACMEDFASLRWLINGK